jgi:ribonuclease-3 family protein
VIDKIKSRFGLTGDDPGQYSPLSLAFIGDSVYGEVAKTVVVLRANCPADALNRKSVKYVKAVSQAKAVDYLLDKGIFTEEEASVYRRGRNAKSPTGAKNASVGDYRKATGLEAVFGYLYLKGDTDRVVELMKTIVDFLDE